VKYYTNKARQAGMTLIELTVVLLVLVGLAGLMIPYVSGFVTKTHDSTGASNIQALNNAMARFAVENYDDYPNKMDSLIQTSDNKVFSKMMSQMYLEPFQLTSDEAASLKAVGITSMMNMDPNGVSGTFANTDGEVTVAKDAYVAVLKGTVLAELGNIMGRTLDVSATSNKFVVMGIGDDSTIQGKTVADVPVHFAGGSGMTADKKYNHFVAVFQVPVAGGHCDVANIAIDEAPGTSAGLQSTDAATQEAIVQAIIDAANPAATTPGVAPATEALCDALIAANEIGDAPLQESDGSGGFQNDTSGAPLVAGDEGESWGVTGVTWVAGGSDAKFIGSAMAMGMTMFEGMGGAINNYYKRLDN